VGQGARALGGTWDPTFTLTHARRLTSAPSPSHCPAMSGRPGSSLPQSLTTSAARREVRQGVDRTAPSCARSCRCPFSLVFDRPCHPQPATLSACHSGRAFRFELALDLHHLLSPSPIATHPCLLLVQGLLLRLHMPLSGPSPLPALSVEGSISRPAASDWASHAGAGAGSAQIPFRLGAGQQRQRAGSLALGHEPRAVDVGSIGTGSQHRTDRLVLVQLHDGGDEGHEVRIVKLLPKVSFFCDSSNAAWLVVLGWQYRQLIARQSTPVRAARRPAVGGPAGLRPVRHPARLGDEPGGSSTRPAQSSWPDIGRPC
jgi:hypothetical protein